MNPQTEIKECPKCHTNHAVPIYVIQLKGNIVFCCNCGCQTTQAYETEEEALKVWNEFPREKLNEARN